RDAAGWRLSGQAGWGTNRAALSARFEPLGWWPVEGRLQGHDLRLPPETWPFRGYETPSFSLTVQITSNRFDLETTGAALPAVLPETATRPKIEATLRARGDPGLVLVHRLEIRAG